MKEVILTTLVIALGVPALMFGAALVIFYMIWVKNKSDAFMDYLIDRLGK